MLVHLGGKGVEGMSKKNIKPFHFLEFSQFELFVKMDPCSLTIEAIVFFTSCIRLFWSTIAIDKFKEEFLKLFITLYFYEIIYFRTCF